MKKISLSILLAITTLVNKSNAQTCAPCQTVASVTPVNDYKINLGKRINCFSTPTLNPSLSMLDLVFFESNVNSGCIPSNFLNTSVPSYLPIWNYIVLPVPSPSTIAISDINNAAAAIRGSVQQYINTNIGTGKIIKCINITQVYQLGYPSGPSYCASTKYIRLMVTYGVLPIINIDNPSRQ